MYPEPFQSPKDNNTQTQANSGTFQHPQAYNTQTQMNTGQFQLSNFGDLYPYSQMPPPPPPTKKNKHAFLWVVFGLLLVLILASTSFIGVQQYERSSGNARTAVPTTLPAQATTAVQPTVQPTLQSTVTPDRSNTSNQEYTASDILQDFIISGASPTVLDHNQTIWSWTSELGSPYYIAVHAKSSVTFRDASGCSGPCDGFLNGGIWVYSDYATAYQAYIDATKDQEQQMQTPPTGPKTIPSVYRHGRCLLLGPGNDSIYTSVVTQYCV